MNRITVLVIAACLLSGCKSLSVDTAAGASSHAYTSFYVVQRENGGMHQVIADELSLLGFQAATGPEAQKPANTNTVVTFNPRWQWDLTMYLLELQIEFRNPQDNSLLVSGRSYRPSLQRKSGNLMTRELLQAMFTKLGKTVEAPEPLRQSGGTSGSYF